MQPSTNNFASADSVDRRVLEIRGGTPLNGEVSLSGAKNAALPAIVAACLSEEPTELSNVPTELNDIKLLIELLKKAGATITEPQKHILVCSGWGWRGGLIDEGASQLRHSLLLLGAAAHWRSPLTLPLPGGCKLGSRKHDLHVTALESLGFDLTENVESLQLGSHKLSQDRVITFHYPTFGGTLNVLFAACTLDGVTLLHNPARNPEVLDVIALLCSMGARISWKAPDVLKIVGVANLQGTRHRVISDRIIASTLIAAAGITQGNIFIRNAAGDVLVAEIAAWQRAGLSIESSPEGVHARFTQKLKATDIETGAYPEFHTDIQPFHAVMMLLAEGSSRIKETILDGRFRYADELSKMGADLSVEKGNFNCVNGAPGQILRIHGSDKLYGADVVATDIRGGAAVAVAALAAEGVSTISNLYQLERGYGSFVETFRALGAELDIKVPHLNRG